MLHIGHIATPLTPTAQAFDDDYIVLAFYEQSTSVRLTILDRSSGAGWEHIVHDAEIVYRGIPDRVEDGVFWLAASNPPALVRVDAVAHEVRRIPLPLNDRRLFGIAQDEEGRLLIGTYPDAGLFSVDPAADFRVSALPVPDTLAAGRKYLHRVAVLDEQRVLLHYEAPTAIAVWRRDAQGPDALTPLHEGQRQLAPYEIVTVLGTLLDGPTSERLEGLLSNVQENQGEILHRLGTSDLRPAFTQYLQDFSAVEDGMKLRLEQRDRPALTASRAPYGEGLPIVALQGVGQGRSVGNTYWNHWMFKVDAGERSVNLLGAVGRMGEFFAACRLGARVLIPHYQGDVLVWDPSEPFAAKANPRLAGHVEGAHFGLDCVEQRDGSALIATAPNYGENAGMLLRFTLPGAIEALSSPAITFSALLPREDRLIAGTWPTRGLGVADEDWTPSRPRLLELGRAGAGIEREVELDDRPGKAVQLIAPMRDGRYLVGVRYGGVHLVDLAGPTATGTAVADLARGYYDGFVSSIWPDLAVLLAKSHVFAFSLADGRLLPGSIKVPWWIDEMEDGAQGSVILASDHELFEISPAAFRAAFGLE